MNKLVALSGSQVDDYFQAGPREMKEEILKRIKSRVDVKLDGSSQLIYTAIMRNVRDTRSGKLSQAHDIKQWNQLQTSELLHQFPSLRAKVSRVTHNRPDISCTVSFASMVTEKSYILEHIPNINQIVVQLQKR